MPYNPDNSGVSALTGQAYDWNTVPTADQVTAWREQAAAELDSVLKALGYAVPATGSRDVTMLAGKEDLFAAVKAEQAAYRGQVQQPRVREWHEQYQAFLNMLRQGQVGLLDQDLTGPDEPYFTSAPAVRRDDYWIPEEQEG